MDTKKTSLKISAIAISILLASCGGGGGGYFDNQSNGTTDGGTITNPQPVATNYHMVIASNKPSLVVSGDTATITIKLVDVNGGGVVAQNVTLAIEDTVTNGITIDGPSTLVTDESGNASFNIKLDAMNVTDRVSLLNKGVRLNATFKDETNKITTQTSVIQAVESLSSESSTTQYFLNMNSNKPTLVVTGDNAKITIKAIDKNGGGVEGQKVVLSILDTLKNGVTIDGPSTGVTDSTGNVVFSVTLPNSIGTIASELIANGITLNASLTDTNGVTTKQSTKLNVSTAVVAQPVGNITFGNSALIETSANGTYYIESLSAHVVDIDGKPIANQTVTMSVNLLSAGQGFYIAGKTAQAAKEKDEFTLKQALVQTNVQADKDKIQAAIDYLGAYTIEKRDQCYSPISISGLAIAPGFVGSDGNISSSLTYTTDSTGKFDFKVTYLRKYASWQEVQLNASVSVSGKKLQSSLMYNLPIVKTDADSEAGQPFDTSPYGVSCNYLFPWTSVVTQALSPN